MQYYSKTLDRNRDKNGQKLNRLKKSESLREKLSCVGVYNYEKPDYPERQEYTESERRSYLQLLKGNYISNSTRNLPNSHNYNTNYNTMGAHSNNDKLHKDSKHKKLVYADLALGNHNLKFKNTVNSNRQLYSINTEAGATDIAGRHARPDYATLNFNEIDV